ncbi:MAG: tetratricopeptide repeat protein, partial [Candidatus Omnitrophota bacterium]|nr:tetratricopeptide repeat protein [Candidatus Omnitrophota bacterium]
MPKSIKKILLISFIIMLALPFLVLSAALPFKQTQYLLLRAVNRKKDVQTKIINYKNFIKKYPFYIPPRLKLAEYHTVLLRPGPEETKHILSAIDQYNATLEIDPANKDALTGLKDIYLWEKRYDKAESICNRLIDLYPEEATSRLTLASIYLSKNMIDEALEETKTAISYDPENGDAYMLAGSIYERKRNLTETLAAYKHAAKYSRKDKKRNTELNARYRLGRLYLRTGLLFDAMQQFERINEIGATSVNFQLELATTYFRLGLHDKLLATLTAAPLNPASWELSPLHKKSIPKTYRAYTHFLFGQVYVAKKDYPRALKYFKDANRLGIKFKAGFFYYLEKLIKAPWGNIEQRYKVGDHTIGTVTDITSYGALIELEEGVKGFVRSSDLSWTEEIIYPGEILKKDEEIEAVILDISEKNRKI